MSKKISITCAQCGHDNPLGALFCEVCRGRMDLSAEKPGLEKAPAARRILPALLLGAVILITALGVLVFWPMRMESAAGGPAARQSFQGKLMALRGGGAVRQSFEEAEINAGLAAALGRFHAPASPWTPRLHIVRVSIRPNGLIAAYQSSWGPFPVRHWLIGPFGFSGRLIYAYHPPTGFSLRRAWLGHVALPGPLARLAVWPVRPFGKAVQAQLVPGRAFRLDMADGAIAVQIQPPSKLE